MYLRLFSVSLHRTYRRVHLNLWEIAVLDLVQTFYDGLVRLGV